MLCDLPEDWNPDKEPRATLIKQGYVLFEWCRGGRSHYETWVLQRPQGPTYHVVHYRWSNDEGWVAALQAPTFSDREDLLVRNPMLTKLVLNESNH